ncbi:MAG: dTMP kinase [Synergistaceae bacterium]|nr:dTMP kinase [Synergistaceae bacterium]
MNAKFITIEGIDGTGKSTQAGKIAHWLKTFTGRETISTFEPGGCETCKKLREFILSSDNYNSLSELLLFLADRAEHVEKLILPELKAGHNVICERYNDSTLAYQSGGHNQNISRARELIKACNFPEPDIKIFLDIDPETAFKRVQARKNLHDKFESEGFDLMKRVADFYRSCSDFIVIKCDNLSIEETFSAIISKLEALLS